MSNIPLLCATSMRPNRYIEPFFLKLSGGNRLKSFFYECKLCIVTYYALYLALSQPVLQYGMDEDMHMLQTSIYVCSNQ